MLDDLFSYRLEDERYLTVTNAANHERDLAWFREHAGGFDAQVIDRAGRLRDDRRAGAAGARDRPGDRLGAAARADDDRRADRRWRADAGRGHRLHRRGRRRAAARSGRRAGGLGGAAAPRRQAGRPRRRATRCAPRPATTSTATTWRPSGARSRPASVGAAAPPAGFIGAEAVAAVRAAGPTRAARAVRDHRPRRRAARRRRRRRRRRHQRHLLADASRRGSGWPTCRSAMAVPGTEFQIDVRGKRRHARVESAAVEGVTGSRLKA